MSDVFRLLSRASGCAARRGELHTAHGTISTPVFMPVGTHANVKGVLPDRLKQIQAQVILGNTFHLYLKPSHQVIEQMGGLHRFMNWDRSILTDSGGFQVFSLSRMNRIDDQGVEFRSPIDGSKHFFTPELTVEIQQALGSDIAMVFDECAPPHAEDAYIQQSIERTFRWAARFQAAHTRQEQLVFGIVQGGISPVHRKNSARQITSLDFDGYGIGGLSVGESEHDTLQMLEVLHPLLPSDRPRYLMGVGSPQLLLWGIERGVDMFDCVLPTRSARHATLYTSEGKIRIRSSRYRLSSEPIEEGCDCLACRQFSRGYVQHLFARGEITGMILASIHNLRFLTRLMEQARKSIEEDTFLSFRDRFLEKFGVHGPSQKGKKEQITEEYR
ncbi:MAG TPA: tRNA guanosine(34) transglycosylase Tgt [Thermotogota bacterium]|nr:tRNA guanosine(34) transglycosylase Tgt [Thermotogota bacterium]